MAGIVDDYIAKLPVAQAKLARQLRMAIKRVGSSLKESIEPTQARSIASLCPPWRRRLAPQRN